MYTAFEEARGRADEADRATARGDDLPPLHGVPTAIKDLFDFEPGWPATFGGIPALTGHSVPARCVWADRIERAGAIILGKTNSPSWVSVARATTRSSARAATPMTCNATRAVLRAGRRARWRPVSCRSPSIVGFKQSWGRVPAIMRPNAFAAVNPFVFEGIMSRTTQDAALVLSVLSGPDSADPFTADLPFTDLEAPMPAPTGPHRGVRLRAELPSDHDLLVTPTLACPPVFNSDDGQTIWPSEVAGVAVDPCIGWCLTYPINFTGHPAASVPAGLAEGLPVGADRRSAPC